MWQKHMAPAENAQQLGKATALAAAIPAGGGLERGDIVYFATKIGFNLFDTRKMRRLKRLPVPFHQPEQQTAQHTHPQQRRAIEERTGASQDSSQSDAPGRTGC